MVSLTGAVISTWLFEACGIWATAEAGIWSGIGWVWRLLQASYLLPGWAVVLLGVLALLAVVSIICVTLYSIWSALRPVRESRSLFLNYTEDMIDGVKWRWQWQRQSNNKMGIDNLWCYCPVCDAQLVYASGAGVNRETLLICEQCPSVASDRSTYNFEPFLGSGSRGRVKSTTMGRREDDIRSPAEREILRRIRTEEFQRQL